MKDNLSPRCHQQCAPSLCMATHRHAHTPVCIVLQGKRRRWEFPGFSITFALKLLCQAEEESKSTSERNQPTPFSATRKVFGCVVTPVSWQEYTIKKSWQIIRTLCCKFGCFVGASTARAAYSGRDQRNGTSSSSSKSSIFPLLRQHVWHNWQLISPALGCELPLNASLVLGLVLS